MIHELSIEEVNQLRQAAGASDINAQIILEELLSTFSREDIQAFCETESNNLLIIAAEKGSLQTIAYLINDVQIAVPSHILSLAKHNPDSAVLDYFIKNHSKHPVQISQLYSLAMAARSSAFESNKQALINKIKNDNPSLFQQQLAEIIFYNDSTFISISDFDEILDRILLSNDQTELDYHAYKLGLFFLANKPDDTSNSKKWLILTLDFFRTIHSHRWEDWRAILITYQHLAVLDIKGREFRNAQTTLDLALNLYKMLDRDANVFENDEEHVTWRAIQKIQDRLYPSNYDVFVTDPSIKALSIKAKIARHNHDLPVAIKSYELLNHFFQNGGLKTRFDNYFYLYSCLILAQLYNQQDLQKNATISLKKFFIHYKNVKNKLLHQHVDPYGILQQSAEYLAKNYIEPIELATSVSVPTLVSLKALESEEALDEEALDQELALSASRQMGKNLARQYGFKCVNAPSDGACFFHAVHTQLMLSNRHLSVAKKKMLLTPDTLRKAAVDYIQEHADFYTPFLMPESVSDYLNKASQTSYWADEHLITALSRVLNINIVTLSTEQPLPHIVKRRRSTATIFLINHQNIHFEGLMPDSEIKAPLSILDCLQRADVDTVMPIQNKTIKTQHLKKSKNNSEARSPVLSAASRSAIPDRKLLEGLTLQNGHVKSSAASSSTNRYGFYTKRSIDVDCISKDSFSSDSASLCSVSESSDSDNEPTSKKPKTF